MPDLVKTWTREQVLALPDDGNRYELVDGELLVSPSPRPAHQIALANLYRLVAAYVEKYGLGCALFSPADLDLGSEQLLQPDLFVTRLVGGRLPREWTECGIPILVAEVLSASTARYDRFTKRRRFQRSGVPAYWVVHLESRLVEIWTPTDEHPTLADERLTWRPDAEVPPLDIDLRSYFQGIWGS